MPYVIWSDMYSINVPYIDTQHKKLLDITNQFHNELKAGQEHAKIFETLNALIKYTEMHFRDEEEIMELAGYPADITDAHKKKHEQLVDDIFKLHADFQNEDKPGLHEVEVFLNSWLIQHILLTDITLVPYCKDLKTYVSHKGERWTC